MTLAVLARPSSRQGRVDVKRLAPLLAAALVACANADRPSEPLVDTSDPVNAWLVRNSVKLLGTDPNTTGRDLEQIETALGSAHLIGVGEATHGTHEFFEMKHRLLRDFVTRLGVT